MCDGLPNTRDRTLTGFSTNHGAPDRRPMVRHCSATATAFAWNIGSAARLAANQRAPLTAMSVQGGKPNRKFVTGGEGSLRKRNRRMYRVKGKNLTLSRADLDFLVQIVSPEAKDKNSLGRVLE